MKVRVILDTNLWISYLIGGQLNKLDHLFRRSDLVLLFSRELLGEFITVASRPKFIKYFSHENLGKLLGQFSRFGELVEPDVRSTLCRDPKDNFLLELALSGSADYLITGDLDLLEIELIGDTRIVTVNEFFARERS